MTDDSHQGVFEGLDALRKASILGLEAYSNITTTPIQWVWDGIAPSGTVTLIAGQPGGGKTTLLFQILAARANPNPHMAKLLLDKEVRPAPPGQYVLLIEAEHSVESTAHKLARSLRVLGVPVEAFNRIITVARQGVTIGSKEWDDIQTLSERGLLSDIAIDTLGRVAQGNANDEEKQIALFERIILLIECAPVDRRPSLWITAHTRKGGEGGVESVSGSVQRTGQVDTVLLVRPRKQAGRVVATRVSFEKMRETPPNGHPEPFIFTEAPVKRNDIEAKIIDILSDGKEYTTNKLRLRIACGLEILESELELLVKTGSIECVVQDKKTVYKKVG